MFTALRIGLVAALSFLAAACQETFEDDYYQSSSVYGEHEEENTREFFERIQNNAGG